MSHRQFMLTRFPDELYRRVALRAADRKAYRDDNASMTGVILDAIEAGLDEMDRRDGVNDKERVFI